MLIALIVAGSFGALLLVPNAPKKRCSRCSVWIEPGEFDAPCFCCGLSVVLKDPVRITVAEPSR